MEIERAQMSHTHTERSVNSILEREFATHSKSATKTSPNFHWSMSHLDQVKWLGLISAPYSLLFPTISRPIYTYTWTQLLPTSLASIKRSMPTFPTQWQGMGILLKLASGLHNRLIYSKVEPPPITFTSERHSFPHCLLPCIVTNSTSSSILCFILFLFCIPFLQFLFL